MPKTAVLFKTHLWNDTVENLYKMCKAQSRLSDIFIIYDDTNGCNLPDRIKEENNILFYNKESIKKIGLPFDEENAGGFWYNGDYHQSLFALDHPDYDFYCSIESDVAVFYNLDTIFESMYNEKIDSIYHELKTPNHNWSWLEGCVGHYDVSHHIHKGLFCISFFSRKAIFIFLRKRIQMAVAYYKGLNKNWPIGEVVMANETVLNHLKFKEISEYCNEFNYYDWSPAYILKEFTEDPPHNTFIHPVTELNNKFYRNNFEIEHRSLCSIPVITSGQAALRIKKIKDITVSSRLLHHDNAQSMVERWKPILEAALESLDLQDRELISANDLLRLEDLWLDNVHAPQNAQRIVWPLPCWEKRHAFPLSGNHVLKINFQRFENVVSIGLVTKSRIKEDSLKLTSNARDNLPISFKGEKYSYFFYGINVEPDEYFVDVSLLNSESIDIYHICIFQTPV